MSNTTQAQVPAQEKAVEAAKAIVSEATVTHDVKISGVAYQQLFSIQKYQQRNKLAMHGAVALEKQRALYAVEHIEELIRKEFELIETRIKNAEIAERDSLFRTLTAKGVPVTEAYALAYSSK